jgi:hypothetical protein
MEHIQSSSDESEELFFALQWSLLTFCGGALLTALVIGVAEQFF